MSWNPRHTRATKLGRGMLLAIVTVFAISVAPAVATPARQIDASETLASCLLGSWVHAYEEDVAGIDVFRPADFPLPPSRGRIGFALHPDGSLTYRAIAPADGVLELAGSWSLAPPNGLSLALPEGTETRRIVACAPGRLVLSE